MMIVIAMMLAGMTAHAQEKFVIEYEPMSIHPKDTAALQEVVNYLKTHDCYYMAYVHAVAKENGKVSIRKSHRVSYERGEELERYFWNEDNLNFRSLCPGEKDTSIYYNCGNREGKDCVEIIIIYR